MPSFADTHESANSGKPPPQEPHTRVLVDPFGLNRRSGTGAVWCKFRGSTFESCTQILPMSLACSMVELEEKHAGGSYYPIERNC